MTLSKLPKHRYKQPNDSDVPAIYHKVNELIESQNEVLENTGWTRATFVYTGAEVVAMNGANGGYGEVLIAAPGAGKTIQIRSSVFRLNLVAGNYVNADLWIYFHDENHYQFATTLAELNGGVPTTFDYSIEPVANATSYPLEYNQALMLWPSQNQTAFAGTLTLTFEYRIVEL